MSEITDLPTLLLNWSLSQALSHVNSITYHSLTISMSPSLTHSVTESLINIVYNYISIYTKICQSTHLSLNPFITQSLHPSIFHPSIHQSIHQYIYTVIYSNSHWLYCSITQAVCNQLKQLLNQWIYGWMKMDGWIYYYLIICRE